MPALSDSVGRRAPRSFVFIDPGPVTTPACRFPPAPRSSARYSPTVSASDRVTFQTVTRSQAGQAGSSGGVGAWGMPGGGSRSLCASTLCSCPRTSSCGEPLSCATLYLLLETGRLPIENRPEGHQRSGLFLRRLNFVSQPHGFPELSDASEEVWAGVRVPRDLRDRASISRGGAEFPCGASE